MNNKGADQTAWIWRPICTFVARIWHDGFSHNLAQVTTDLNLCVQNSWGGGGGASRSVGCVSAWYSDSHGFDPPVQQHSFVETGHEIISTAILSLPQNQVG